MLRPSKTRWRDFNISQSNLRDCTYVATYMREYDWKEISCQLPEDSKRSDAGAFCWHMSGGLAWTVCDWGEPVAVFGLTPMTLAQNSYMLWMFGKESLVDTLPFVGSFFTNVVLPDLEGKGLTRIEVRALESNDATHLWLINLGAHAVGPLESFGRGGEDFILYAWTWGCMTDKVRRRYSAFSRRYPIVQEGGVWYFKQAREG